MSGFTDDERKYLYIHVLGDWYLAHEKDVYCTDEFHPELDDTNLFEVPDNWQREDWLERLVAIQTKMGLILAPLKEIRGIYHRDEILSC